MVSSATSELLWVLNRIGWSKDAHCAKACPNIRILWVRTLINDWRVLSRKLDFKRRLNSNYSIKNMVCFRDWRTSSKLSRRFLRFTHLAKNWWWTSIKSVQLRNVRIDAHVANYRKHFSEACEVTFVPNSCEFSRNEAAVQRQYYAEFTFLRCTDLTSHISQMIAMNTEPGFIKHGSGATGEADC